MTMLQQGGDVLQIQEKLDQASELDMRALQDSCIFLARRMIITLNLINTIMPSMYEEEIVQLYELLKLLKLTLLGLENLLDKPDYISSSPCPDTIFTYLNLISDLLKSELKMAGEIYSLTYIKHTIKKLRFAAQYVDKIEHFVTSINQTHAIARSMAQSGHTKATTGKSASPAA